MIGVDVVFKLAVIAALFTQVALNGAAVRWLRALHRRLDTMESRLDALESRLEAVQQLQMRQGRTPRLSVYSGKEEPV